MYAAPIMCRYCGARIGVKMTLLMSTLVGLPWLSRVKPCGVFIHAFTERIENAPTRAMNGSGSPTRKWAPGAHPLPAVDVDRDEDRLEEERPALDAESDADHVAPLAHQARPQQAELQADHGARHRPDGELDGHHGGPSPGQLHRGRVATAQAEVVHHQGDERQRDAERDQDHVHHQGERHLLASRQQLGGSIGEHGPSGEDMHEVHDRVRSGG